LPDSQVLTIEQGQTKAWALGPITDGNGVQVTTFSGSDVPTAKIWPGDSEAAIDTPTVTWIQTAAPASLNLTITPTDTAALEVQPYPIEAWVAHSGQNLLVWRGWLDVSASSGSAAAPAVYSTFGDMLDVAGDWIKDLLFRSGTAGFLRQRARARSYLEDVLLARYRPQQLGYRPDISLGYGWWTLPEAPNQVLRGYLASNYLIVTAKVREICSHLALSYACRRDLGNAGDGNPYLARAGYHWRRAHQLIAGYVAEVDINADGIADVTINCGNLNMRAVW
jgi:hypothetical protein